MASPRWLDPKISVGNVLTIIGMVIAMTSSWFMLTARVDANAVLIELIQAENAKTDERMRRIEAAAQQDRLNTITTLTGIQSDLKYIREVVSDLRQDRPTYRELQ